MPEYDYKCCINKKITAPIDHERPKCPKCGKVMCRVFKGIGIIFKGDGWTK